MGVGGCWDSLPFSPVPLRLSVFASVTSGGLIFRPAPSPRLRVPSPFSPLQVLADLRGLCRRPGRHLSRLVPGVLSAAARTGRSDQPHVAADAPRPAPTRPQPHRLCRRGALGPRGAGAAAAVALLPGSRPQRGAGDRPGPVRPAGLRDGRSGPAEPPRAAHPGAAHLQPRLPRGLRAQLRGGAAACLAGARRRPRRLARAAHPAGSPQPAPAPGAGWVLRPSPFPSHCTSPTLTAIPANNLSHQLVAEKDSLLLHCPHTQLFNL